MIYLLAYHKAGYSFVFGEFQLFAWERIQWEPNEIPQAFESRLYVTDPGHSGLLPILVILDADSNWEVCLLEINQLRTRHIIPPILVVGMAYSDVPPQEISLLRIRDLSPPMSLEEKRRMKTEFPFFKPMDLGGADPLLALLREKIIPEIEAIYSIDHEQIMLFGHSIAGLTVLYEAMHPDSPFDHFAAASPSLWWNRQWFFKQMKDPIIFNAMQQRQLYLGVGSEEENASDRFFRMITNLYRLSEELGRACTHAAVYPAQTHAQTRLTALQESMKTFFPKECPGIPPSPIPEAPIKTVPQE